MTRMARRDLVIGSMALFLALAVATTVVAQPRRPSPDGGAAVAAVTSRGPVAQAPASNASTAEVALTLPTLAWSHARAVATPLIVAAAFGVILALACWQPSDPSRARIPRRRRRL